MSKKRLREQEISPRPRIIIQDPRIGKYHVEYLGLITGGHCGMSYTSLAAAMDYATSVGTRQAARLAQIERAQQMPVAA